MISLKSLVLATLLLVQQQVPVVQAATVNDPAQYVNNFIGSRNGGHVFVGASRPFGSVKAVADAAGDDNQGGFVSPSPPNTTTAISGFSSTHDDGTGGSPSLGNFKFLPQLCDYPSKCPVLIQKRKLNTVKDTVKASPGFFSTGLESGVTVSVTSTDHVALYRFEYPVKSNVTPLVDDQVKRRDVIRKHRRRKALDGTLHHDRASTANSTDKATNGTSTKPPPKSTQRSTLLLDLTQDLPQTWQGNGALDITLSGAGVKRTAKVTGYGEFLPSFGAGTYKLYFCATVPGVESAATYKNGSAPVDGRLKLVNPPEKSGAVLAISDAFLHANKGVVPVRMGISWTSVDKACQYGEAEVPTSSYQSQATFDKIVQDSRVAWNNILSKVDLDLTGVSKETTVNFYSSLYRTFLAPTNITGDNPLWQSSEPYWDSMYCIWDSARGVHSAWVTLIPDVQAQFVRAMLDVYRNEGFLPDCRMSTDKGFTQGGSNAEMLLSDSYVKGLSKYGGIDWKTGLDAMIKDAEVSPPDWGLEGRGGIEARKKLGYVPADRPGDGNKPDGANVTPGRTASRTIEYAFNDLSIALVAAGEGRKDVYDDFVKRSGDWRNLWNKDLVSDGYKGFIQPRFANGTFAFQDPRRCAPSFQFGTCYLNKDGGEFYEASGFQYSFGVPHDMNQVVGLMGGDNKYLDRLDYIWEKMYGDVGDEVGFLVSVQYAFAKNGYQRGVDRTLDLLGRYFNTSTNGLPGNDDSGAMGSYVLWNYLGLFPNSGTGVYLLTTPHFPSWSIKSGITGKTATLHAKNWDGATKNKYIASATLNGAKFTRSWISHEELFMQGGTLEIVLGPAPSKDFGATDADLPPSLSTGGFKFEQNASKGF